MRKNCFLKKKFNTPPPPPPARNLFHIKFFFNVGNRMKREENMKFWRNIIFVSIFKKFIQNSNNIPSISKTIQHTPHYLVHVPAKFRENTAMRFWVTVWQTARQTDRLTDGQTDGGVAISPVPGLRRWREITRGNHLKTHFSFMGQNAKKNVYFGLFGGPWGGWGLQWSDWAYLAFQLSSHPYLCTCEIRKQSDKKFLSLNPKYVFICGGPRGPYVETRWTKISGQ